MALPFQFGFTEGGKGKSQLRPPRQMRCGDGEESGGGGRRRCVGGMPGRIRIRSLVVVAERRVVVDGVVRGGAGGGGELEEEVAEVGDGAGDAERAGVAVPVLLRGASEQRGEGRAAEELGAHGVPLHGPAFLADAHGHVALRHARAAAQPPRAGQRGRLGGRGRGVRPERLVRGGGARVGRGHAGEAPEQALHDGDGSGGSENALLRVLFAAAGSRRLEVRCGEVRDGRCLEQLERRTPHTHTARRGTAHSGAGAARCNCNAFVLGLGWWPCGSVSPFI